ncbi:glycosyltransferase family 4 protein, partial [Candidatus Pacearchaeota archaeon]|nr:glycosyltransferase family 4 protein [Candidatus Pacearchaeota archaeon]
MLCLKENGHDFKLLEGGSVMIGFGRKLLNFLLSCGKRDVYLYRRLKIHLLRMAKETERLLADNSFDLIHCHDAVAGYAAHLALHRVKQQIPVVETIHGPLAYEAKMTVGWEIDRSKYLSQLFQLEREAFVSSDHLIAVDTGQANIAINDFGINKGKITVMFNCVSCETIDSVIKDPPFTKVAKPYLLVPRRLVEKTGVRIAIEALAKINSEVPVNLVIAGDGPLKNELMQLAENLGLCNQVSFLGSVPRQEVLRLAKDALAVIVPSIPASGVVEATSIAVIEAMACGTVAIASDIGGLAELIRHDQTGFLVPHSDPSAIAGVVLALLEDQDMRNEICRQGR